MTLALVRPDASRLSDADADDFSAVETIETAERSSFSYRLIVMHQLDLAGETCAPSQEWIRRAQNF